MSINIKALEKLRDFLLTLDDQKFAMHSYFMNPQRPERTLYVRAVGTEIQTFHVGYADKDDEVPNCGTAACALGWSILITPVEDIKSAGATGVGGQISPGRYSRDYLEIEDGSSEWQFLFSHWWTHIDNSPKGAAFRINFLLEAVENGAEVWDEDERALLDDEEAEPNWYFQRRNEWLETNGYKL